jgi:hypothetical protein
MYLKNDKPQLFFFSENIVMRRRVVSNDKMLRIFRDHSSFYDELPKDVPREMFWIFFFFFKYYFFNSWHVGIIKTSFNL